MAGKRTTNYQHEYLRGIRLGLFVFAATAMGIITLAGLATTPFPVKAEDQEPVDELNADLALVTGADASWDKSDSLDRLGIELENVFELTADGERVRRLGNHGALEKGKTYEADINLYNDSEVDCVRDFEVQLTLNKSKEQFIIKSTVKGAEHSRFAETVDFDLAPGAESAKLMVNGSFDLALKDADLKLDWEEVSHESDTKNSDELAWFTLMSEAQLRETSMQTVTVRFGLQ